MQDSSSRDDRDVFRLAPTMDASMLQTIADRLEFRGTDDGYSRLSQEHFARLPVGSAQRILALGCGTGIEVRALRRIAPAGVTIVGVDHSQVLVDTARRLTADEGLDRNVTYETADAHRLPYAEGEFDVVTLHTLISHVDDPRQVLNETCRVVTPGGTVAVFDGDYASMTFGYPDNALGKGSRRSCSRSWSPTPGSCATCRAYSARPGWSSQRQAVRCTPRSVQVISGPMQRRPTAPC